MIFGHLNAQVSLYISPEFYTKMSFNSIDYSDWVTLDLVKTDNFIFKGGGYDVSAPFNLGISIGMRLNKKNELQIGIHSDGVSRKDEFRYLYFDSISGGIIKPGYVKFTYKTIQSKIYFKYKYYLNTSNRLYIAPSIGVVYRGGAKGISPGGRLGFSNLIGNNNYTYDIFSRDYTDYRTKIILLGFEIGNDFYNKKNNYLFSLSLLYSHTKKSLYFDVVSITSKNNTTGEQNKYEFTFYNRASGLYLTLSRKISIRSKNQK